ncbi:hypothetical protein ACSBR2_039839 [Camellia fascicularis]
MAMAQGEVPSDQVNLMARAVAIPIQFSNTILNITTCCKSPTKSTKPAIPQPQSPPTARETTPSPSPNAAITSSYVASPVTARLDRRLTSMCVGLHSLRSTCCTSSKCCCSTV